MLLVVCGIQILFHEDHSRAWNFSTRATFTSITFLHPTLPPCSRRSLPFFFSRATSAVRGSRVTRRFSGGAPRDGGSSSSSPAITSIFAMKASSTQ